MIVLKTVHFCVTSTCNMSKKRLSKIEIARAKDYAKNLYTKSNVTTQKELAERSGISEKTIGNWIRDENWETERSGLMFTRDFELKRLYKQFTTLNDAIATRPPLEQYPTPSEADTLTKITASIDRLDKKESWKNSSETLMALVNFVRSGDTTKEMEITRLVMKWADLYLKTLI